MNVMSTAIAQDKTGLTVLERLAHSFEPAIRDFFFL